ncbi:MAG: phosphatidylglycerol lysyltransferase domain-containing protein [Dehalococcoidia bacterium]|nr:phosphatidylglycerol lysyltransferase domain-containing protein [Dehalococcoidia bacterium]
MTIPIFPEFAPIALEHKQEIDQAFKNLAPSASEMTFTNQFMWRYCYNISVSRLQGFLLFLAEPSEQEPFFYPPWGPGDTAGAVKQCLGYLEDRGGGHLERVSRDFVEKRLQNVPGLEIAPDPANDDYVYSSRDLGLLRGRRFANKRNALKQFEGQYSFEYRPIDKEGIRHCLELQDFWCIERNCKEYPGLRQEERAIKEAFNNFEDLGITGGTIMINGRVEAFAVGERLNENTFVVHLEKANPRIKQLYAVINREFSRHEGVNYTYINREQDLGEKGLRQAKRSYNPVFMVNKFRVKLKK